MALLCCTKDGEGLQMLPEPCREKCHGETTMKTLATLLRASNSIDVTRPCVLAIHREGGITVAALSGEIADLAVLLEPTNATVERSALKEAKARFEADASLKLRKAITLLPFRQGYHPCGRYRDRPACRGR